MTHLPGRSESLLHAAIWQGLWCWLVWAAGRDATLAPLLASVASLVAAAWRLGPERSRWWPLAAAALAAGLLVDGLLAASGLIAYRGGWGALSPPWILALWLLFAAGLALPLRGIVRSVPVAIVAGLVGGPLAYAGGEAFDAVTLPSGRLPGLAGAGIGYAVATPLLLRVAQACARPRA